MTIILVLIGVMAPFTGCFGETEDLAGLNSPAAAEFLLALRKAQEQGNIDEANKLYKQAFEKSLLISEGCTNKCFLEYLRFLVDVDKMDQVEGLSIEIGNHGRSNGYLIKVLKEQLLRQEVEVYPYSGRRKNDSDSAFEKRTKANKKFICYKKAIVQLEEKFYGMSEDVKLADHLALAKALEITGNLRQAKITYETIQQRYSFSPEKQQFLQKRLTALSETLAKQSVGEQRNIKVP